MKAQHLQLSCQLNHSKYRHVYPIRASNKKTPHLNIYEGFEMIITILYHYGSQWLIDVLNF